MVSFPSKDGKCLRNMGITLWILCGSEIWRVVKCLWEFHGGSNGYDVRRFFGQSMEMKCGYDLYGIKGRWQLLIVVNVLMKWTYRLFTSISWPTKLISIWEDVRVIWEVTWYHELIIIIIMNYESYGCYIYIYIYTHTHFHYYIGTYSLFSYLTIATPKKIEV